MQFSIIILELCNRVSIVLYHVHNCIVFSIIVSLNTMHTAPNGPPSMFNIEAINETAIEALWGLPALNVRNGIIRGYKLFVQIGASDEVTMNITSNNTQAYIIGGLQPRTAYTVSILAYTAAGDGPRSVRLTTVTRICKIQTSYYYQSVTVCMITIVLLRFHYCR